MVTSLVLAHWLGGVASVCFVIQYVPQIWHNYGRKSVEGFSTSSIIIKLVGAAFLAVNSALLGEALPVFMYGIGNLMAHSMFMYQFSQYITPVPGKGGLAEAVFGATSKHYLLWVLFPLVPLALGYSWPQSMEYTSVIKPITQLVSHLPQLYECWKLKTTKGCSMFTQHLNLVGGVCGIYLCLVVTPKTNWTYVLYANTIFQATSLYLLAYLYDGFPLSRPRTLVLPTTIPDTV
eukprot:m51a1_g13882 hypothetical protein (234) ;mRNA; r:653240-654492